MPIIVPSSIGGLNVDIIRGLPQKLKSRVDTWEVPGLDGYGAQILGLGGARFPLTSVIYVVDTTAADGHIDAANALQGTIVSVDDDWGGTYDNILVTDLKSKKTPVRNYAPGGVVNTVRVEIEWSMLMCASGADDGLGGG